VPKAFLKRIQPARERWKLLEWPFAVDGEDRPKVKMCVLSQTEAEAAHLATIDHFKARKPAVSVLDLPFAARERAEIVFRAYSDEGEALARNVDELTDELSKDAILELYNTWSQFQSDVTAAPHTSQEMDELVEYLKKSGDPARLSGFPSTWLIGLITTLASRLSSSTPANEHG
jgi:hypothetical protein